MNLFLCILLSLSAYATADWVVINNYAGNDGSCSGANTGAVAHILNTCLPDTYSTGSSKYYNYTASVNTSYVVQQSYFSSGSCSGDSTFDSRILLGVCDGGSTATYSATKPTFSNAVVSETLSDSCGSSAVEIDADYLGVCNTLGGLASIKYGYYGGGSCVQQYFNSSDCTGAVLSGATISGTQCTSGNTNTYCVVNGATIATQSTTPTVTAGSQYIAVRGYSGKNCTGTTIYTVYQSANGCDGQGTLSAVSTTTTKISVYDNANCTGYLAYNVTVQNGDDSDVGKCESEDTPDESGIISSKGTFETLPSGSAVPIGVVNVDRCDNPTQTYFAVVYTSSCIQVNSTTSIKPSCHVVGSNTTVNITYYQSTDCTGKVIYDDGESLATCGPSDDNPAVYSKVLCSSVLPNTSGKSSDATSSKRVSFTSSVLYAVVMVMIVAVYAV